MVMMMMMEGGMPRTGVAVMEERPVMEDVERRGIAMRKMRMIPMRRRRRRASLVRRKRKEQLSQVSNCYCS
jgi:hypothetical protein